MEIVHKNEFNKTDLDNIVYGGAFIHAGQVCMRTSAGDGVISAKCINLSSGDIFCLALITRVEGIIAKVIVS